MAFAPSLCPNPSGRQCSARSRFRTHQKRTSSLLVGAVLLSLVTGAVWWFGTSRSPAEPTRADIVFVLDATGSMGDEIEDVKASLMTIGNRLANRKPQPDVRFGAVFYRDVSDEEITRVVPLSKDLPSVREAIMDVRATGGGDWPEHVGIGLHKALEMDWSHSEKGGVRLIYLVGDAPPQSYDDGYDVGSALNLAKQLGVKIHVIGCSGLGSGEADMRKISETTSGSFSHFERQRNDQHRSSGSAGRSSPEAPSRRRRTSAAPRSFSRSDRDESPVVGIDLGTTFSAVGIFKNGRVEIIPNDRGSRITPSYVEFSNASAFVGDTSVASANVSEVIFDVKRLIGQKYNSPDVQKDLEFLSYNVVEEKGKPVIVAGDGWHMSPEEVTAIILRKMRSVAEDYLGQEVRRAVITVPAHFSDSQRQSTKDAGTIAGLNVLRIINEPTAAAIAYGLDKKSEQNIIVYDLGGGTLDVSLLAVDNGVFEVIATHGNAHLGGRDFDDRVIQDLLWMAQAKHGLNISGDRALFKLRAAAVKAKHALSSAPNAVVNIEDVYSGTDFRAELSRARFEHLNKDLFDETLNSLHKVLNDSGFRKDQIAEIVLTGGSTRIPKIQQLVKEFFDGKEPNRGINPDEAVAYGAAVQAGVLSGEGGSDLLLLDVTPLTLGVAASNGSMVPFISRNTVIPTKKTQIMSTDHDNQPALVIRVYEGERLMAKDNHLLGEFRIDGLSPAPRGQPRIEVTFEIDSNGILNVGAQDLHTGKSEKTTITNDKGRLTEEEMEDMIRDAEALAGEDAELARLLEGNGTNESCSGDCFPRVGVDRASSLPAGLGRAPGVASKSVAPSKSASSTEADDDDGADEADEGLGRLSAMMFHSISDEL